MERENSYLLPIEIASAWCVRALGFSSRLWCVPAGSNDLYFTEHLFSGLERSME